MKIVKRPSFIEKIYKTVYSCSGCGTRFQLEEGADSLKVTSESADEVSGDIPCSDAGALDQLIKGNTDCLSVELTPKDKEELVKDMRTLYDRFKEYEGFNIYCHNKDVTYLSCSVNCPICGKKKTLRETIYGGNFLTGCYKVSYREANGVDIAYIKNYGYLIIIIALGENSREDIAVLESLNYHRVDDKALIPQLIKII